METITQHKMSGSNIQKAQDKWQNMTPREHSMAQPQGRKRNKPGAKGTGDYYRIVVRPKDKFISFRTQDVGVRGGLQRVAGKQSRGSWATQAWLVHKGDAHITGKKLIADSGAAKELFENLGSQPTHVEGDIFKAKDRRNIAEGDKPTTAQKRARSQNIKKAQAANRQKNNK